MIHVTQPSLAPLDEFLPYLREIWSTGVMTHNGPFLQRLERELASRFDVPDVVCVANATVAMQIALRALDVTDGEVITTPFTFVATANIIRWERCTPVFVDIEPGTWNLDPAQVEAAITPRTKAILPVHVFSAPCAVEAIDEIARRRGLKVIYDAAHATDVRRQGRSLMTFGDVSCLSFHATKLFNTCEGGACITRDPELARRLRRMRFFGFDEGKEIVDDGMNGKLTEIGAALGLANLKYIDQVKANRRRKYELYLSCLEGRENICFHTYDPDEYNYSYMPVIFDSETTLLRVEAFLKARGVTPRRYFWPALHLVRAVNPNGHRGSLPVAEKISSTVLCLPLYDTLADDDVRQVAGWVLEAAGRPD
ncbi:MAG: DegT/DnrJ/EryC1/StrS family aminotransferase [Ideonella sp.]|jgi:hypothetical protein|nr:DegT/DnrJ/EryC1/StrS family aminotransferase [Ideonella sp.]